MELTVQLLGTGSAFAKKNYNNNAIIRSGDFTLLIDCGITAPFALHELNLAPFEIDGILITHIHADHVGGLEELAFVMKFKYGRKPVLYIAESLREPLWEHTLRGGMESARDGWTSLDDFFEVRVVPESNPYELAPGFVIELLPTVHVPDKPAYSVLLNGMVFYSADTQFNRSMLEEIAYRRKVPYLLHECQLRPPGIIHTTLNELLSLPPDIQERIQLMHYGDEFPEYAGKTGPMTFLQQHEIYRYP